MMPASPPPAPNPFRAPPPVMPSHKPSLWLAPGRHASASWHLGKGKTAKDPSFRWGDDNSNWIN